MEMPDWQVDAVEDKIKSYGATGTLLNELTDHWCVLVNLEMNEGSSFEDALLKTSNTQSAKAMLLVNEIQQVRFPYVISNVSVTVTGAISLIVFLSGIVLRLSGLAGHAGLLLPGYLLTGYIFLPLWFLKKLQTTSDKVNSTLLFLSLLSFTHLVVLWLNHARPRWIALLCWLIFVSFWLWNRMQRKAMFQKQA